MPQRSNEIDVLRLAALVGICVVNIPVMAQSTAAFFFPPDALIDRLGVFFVAAFFQLKFFLLFSFVFGWGVHIQARSALRRGQSFKQRYFRRMVGLALLGAMHAVFVFNGDILLPYALLGCVFWFVRDYSVMRLLSLVKWMVPLSMCCLFLFAVLLEMAELDDKSLMNSWDSGRGENFLDATSARILNWPAAFTFIILVQGPLVFGSFAVGLAAAKADFFTQTRSLVDLLHEKLALLLVVAVPLNLLYAGTISGLIPEQWEILELIGFVFIPIGAPALTAVYIYLFLRFSKGRNIPLLFIQAGQNSLSTYVLQGVIAGFFFSAYGLGYYNTMGQSRLLPVSVVIAGISILIAGLYARLFGRGPLEPLLR